MGEVFGLLLLFSLAVVMILLTTATALVIELRHPRRRAAGYALAHRLDTEPSDSGHAFDEWMLQRPERTDLPAWTIHTPGPLPVTVVFVHSWGSSRIDMLNRLDPWPELVDRIVLYDRPGHGETPGPASLGDGEVEDVVALIERLDRSEVVLVAGGDAWPVASAAAKMIDRDASLALVVPARPSDTRGLLQRRLRAARLPCRPLVTAAMMILRLRGIRPLTLVSFERFDGDLAENALFEPPDAPLDRATLETWLRGRVSSRP